MKPTILVMSKLMPAQQVQLEEEFNVVPLYASRDPEKLLQDHKDDIQGIIATTSNPVRQHLMEALSALEIIALDSVGFDNVDIETAKQRSIKITNTPDVVTADTADTALGLLINCARRMVEADMFVRVGQWEGGSKKPRGTSLAGKTAGIVGLGRIGQAIAKRLSAFDINVVYHGRNEKKGMPYQYHSDLETMASLSDFLILSCTGGEETRGLITKDILESLGEKGYLINVARGSVVNEDHLVEALQNNVIAGAGLDVYANEPNVPQELRSLDNVVLMPHIGAQTHETLAIMSNIVLENLQNHFGGKALLTEVA
jgi:hydroxypyruvate reductase